MSIGPMTAIFFTEFRDLPRDEVDENGKPKMTKASTAKILLLAIADQANDEGEGAYPGFERLKVKTGLSRQGIADTLEALKYNGLIDVDEEKSKFGTNVYTINLTCFPGTNKKDGFAPLIIQNEASQATLPVKPLAEGSQATLPELVKPLDLKHTLNQQETPKKGDLVDGLLHYEKESLKDNPVEDVLTRLDISLHANIVRSGANQDIAKWILKQEKKGETLDKWLAWLKNDEWRLGHLYVYAQNLEKIRIEWPQAFIEPYRDPRMKEWHDD
jgi:hypothetical protein